MSIQNNTTSLRAEQTELEALLAQVNALPDALPGTPIPNAEEVRY